MKDRTAQVEQIASDIRSGNTGYMNEFLGALVSDKKSDGFGLAQLSIGGSEKAFGGHIRTSDAFFAVFIDCTRL